MSKFYLAGPMTGRDKRAAALKFAMCAKALQDRGWDVIVPPIDADPLNEDGLRTVIRRDLNAVTSLSPEAGDALVVMTGHELSSGTEAERSTSRWFRLRILTYDEAVAEGGDGPVDLI